MGDGLGGAKRRHAPATAKVISPRQSAKETSGIQIAGPGGVDDLRYRVRVNDMDFGAGHDHRSARRAGERRDRHAPAHQLQRLVEVARPVKRPDLALTPSSTAQQATEAAAADKAKAEAEAEAKRQEEADRQKKIPM